MAKLSQGAKANMTGKIFENQCKPLFEEYGFILLDNAKYEKLKAKNQLPDKYVILNAPFTTIYNHKGKTEFVIVDNTLNKRIRVENKYQSAAGSVDEKYPYVLLNAIEAYPENEIIIVIDGGGYKDGALEWIKTKVKDNWLDYKSTKKIEIMSIIEFNNWFFKTFS